MFVSGCARSDLSRDDTFLLAIYYALHGVCLRGGKRYPLMAVIIDSFWLCLAQIKLGSFSQRCTFLGQYVHVSDRRPATLAYYFSVSCVEYQCEALTDGVIAVFMDCCFYTTCHFQLSVILYAPICGLNSGIRLLDICVILLPREIIQTSLIIVQFACRLYVAVDKIDVQFSRTCKHV